MLSDHDNRGIVRAHPGGGDVHFFSEVAGSSEGPRERHDVVRGKLYACEWLQSPIVGDYPGHEPRPMVVSRSRALWVPEAGILLQWPLPEGTIQITARESFPPPTDVARVAFLEDRFVPNAAIREARKYLEWQAHVHGQQATMLQALDRMTEQARRIEHRVQTALTRASITL